jgi:hypothetical protein
MLLVLLEGPERAPDRVSKAEGIQPTSATIARTVALSAIISALGRILTVP